MSTSVADSRVASPLDLREEPRHGWIVSLAFWLCLLFATILYAAIALSPRLFARLTLEQEYRTNQVKLVGIERQIDHLQKVVEALKHDAGFAKELARIDFDVVHGDEERIPVESNLALSPRQSGPDLHVAAADLPWYAPLLRMLAFNRQVGNSLLAMAAVVTLYAFTCLGERGFHEINRARIPRAERLPPETAGPTPAAS